MGFIVKTLVVVVVETKGDAWCLQLGIGGMVKPIGQETIRVDEDERTPISSFSCPKDWFRQPTRNGVMLRAFWGIFRDGCLEYVFYL